MHRQKEEIRDPAVAGAIDAALSFGELRAWLAEEDVALEVSSPPAEPAPRSDARAFPVEGA